MVKAWTEDEAIFLEDHWAYQTLKTIAKQLNRSESSVEQKAKRLGMGSPYTTGESMSAHQAAKVLGIDVHTITDQWIAKHGLSARRRAMRNQIMWRINQVNLMKWLRNNPAKWNASRVELFALGSEPSWLKEKRKQDFIKPTKRFYKWTEAEDKNLITFYKGGLKREEIALRMARSESGIQRRISRLKEIGALPKSKIIIKWKENEESLLSDLETKGLSDLEIAFSLGREREHIVDHRRNLRLKGMYDGRKLCCK